MDDSGPGRQPAGGDPGPDDLIADLAGFVADEDRLLDSLRDVLDELAAVAAPPLGSSDRADLWQRIQARVDPAR